jgi:cob(I)alamin adenosyltransferase|tara:strand:- start:3492 stop:4115 length:624 start_codon:yes stop_codon:yes gene_type:complete
MKIYTKSGDEGHTSFYGGKRVLKNDIFVTAYGEVDELNSSIGVVIALLKATRINYTYFWWYKHFTKGKIRKCLIKQLEEIQNSLFNVGFELATPIEHQMKNDKGELFKNLFNEQNIKDIEKAIDKMEESLPPLENFILPTGVLPAAQMQLSRAICRRAERSIVTANQDTEVSQNILVYINRLSDYLFVLARYTHRNFGIGNEKLWKK